MPRLDHIGYDAADECDAEADRRDLIDAMRESMESGYEEAKSECAAIYELRLQSALATRHEDQKLLAAIDLHMESAAFPGLQVLDAVRGDPTGLREWVMDCFWTAGQAHGEALTFEAFISDLEEAAHKPWNLPTDEYHGGGHA